MVITLQIFLKTIRLIIPFSLVNEFSFKKIKSLKNVPFLNSKKKKDLKKKDLKKKDLKKKDLKKINTKIWQSR